jgi:Ca2+-transporting ATPase
MYQTDVQNGLTTDRYNILYKHYGGNIIPPPPSPSVLKMLWTQLTDFMLVVLIVVMIIQFAVICLKLLTLFSDP